MNLHHFTTLNLFFYEMTKFLLKLRSFTIYFSIFCRYRNDSCSVCHCGNKSIFIYNSNAAIACTPGQLFINCIVRCYRCYKLYCFPFSCKGYSCACYAKNRHITTLSIITPAIIPITNTVHTLTKCTIFGLGDSR